MEFSRELIEQFKKCFEDEDSQSFSAEQAKCCLNNLAGFFITFLKANKENFGDDKEM